MLDKMSNEINDMKQYSEPSFPAGEAWKSMQDVLDKEMPVGQKRKKRFAFFWFFPIVIATVGIFLFTNKHSDTTKILANNNLEKNIITSTKSVNETVINSESNNNKVMLLSDNILNETPQKNSVETESLRIKNSFELSKSIRVKSSNKSQLQKQYLISKNIFLHEINKEKQFASRASFSDLREMKIDRGETINTSKESTKNLGDILNNSSAESAAFIESSEKNEEKKTVLKTPSNTANNALAKTPVKVPKNKMSNSLRYGLQWNILLPQANNYLDYNAKSQPLSVVIPEFWVSKNVGLKGEIGLQLNPYSQYTLQSNNVLASNDYSVSILQGSTTIPTTLKYVQTRSLLKAMGVELTAKYTYHLNKNFSLALGVGNNWLNAAVVNDRIVGVNDKLVHDSLYGIAKGFSDWNYLKSSFFVGRFEVLYQFKKLQLGLAFVKPLGDIYSFSNTNINPINSRLVLRWKIK
jgi:hypothetical protein